MLRILYHCVETSFALRLIGLLLNVISKSATVSFGSAPTGVGSTLKSLRMQLSTLASLISVGAESRSGAFVRANISNGGPKTEQF